MPLWVLFSLVNVRKIVTTVFCTSNEIQNTPVLFARTKNTIVDPIDCAMENGELRNKIFSILYRIKIKDFIHHQPVSGALLHSQHKSGDRSGNNPLMRVIFSRSSLSLSLLITFPRTHSLVHPTILSISLAMKTRRTASSIPTRNNKKARSNPMTTNASTDSSEGIKVPADLHKVVPMLSLTPLQFQKPDDKSAEHPNPSVVQMPQIGFGTYKFKKDSGEAETAVLQALSVGYRHIDTAFIYGGEKTELEVGRALQQAMSDDTTLKRSDLFVTTKQWRAYHGYEKTKQCLAKSLTRLQLDYVDLYLIHWPGPNPADVRESESEINMPELRRETWRAMEDLYLEGKCRAIGVSNCSIAHLESLKGSRLWPPAVNQIEVHPYHPQTALIEYCKKEGITVQAYASLGGQDAGKKAWKVLGGRLLDREEVKQIAEKHKLTTAQVLLQWAAVQGFAVIPKSTKVNHMLENLEAVAACGGENDSESPKRRLDDADMKLLKKLDLSQSKDEEIRDRVRLCWVRDPLKLLEFE